MKIIIPIILAVILISFFIWIFNLIRKESKKITVKTYQELKIAGTPELKCPKCNDYMDVGYTIASRGLLFRKQEEKFKPVATDKLIPNTANLGFGMKENLAWKCNNCKLVLIDYSCQVKK